MSVPLPPPRCHCVLAGQGTPLICLLDQKQPMTPSFLKFLAMLKKVFFLLGNLRKVCSPLCRGDSLLVPNLSSFFRLLCYVHILAHALEASHAEHVQDVVLFSLQSVSRGTQYSYQHLLCQQGTINNSHRTNRNQTR